MKNLLLLCLVILLFACKKDDDPQPLNAPVAITASDITNESFTANWNAVDGVTDYLLYVSLENFPADPPNNLPDYNGKEVTGTSHDVIGLNSETIYYYVVKAKVDERISNASNAIMTQTTIDFRDGYVGDYTCLQMYYYFDPIGDTVLNWSMDTVSLNQQISIQKMGDSSLSVTIDWYSYEARYEGDQKFTCIDCNGPPDYVRFYAIDSINSYQKSGVLNWYRFIGKKNHLE